MDPQQKSRFNTADPLVDGSHNNNQIYQRYINQSVNGNKNNQDAKEATFGPE